MSYYPFVQFDHDDPYHPELVYNDDGPQRCPSKEYLRPPAGLPSSHPRANPQAGLNLSKPKHCPPVVKDKKMTRPSYAMAYCPSSATTTGTAPGVTDWPRYGMMSIPTTMVLMPNFPDPNHDRFSRHEFPREPPMVNPGVQNGLTFRDKKWTIKPVAYDPCPEKKGPDCLCFNPDGTMTVKAQQKMAAKKRKEIEMMTVRQRRCGDDDCPECPIELASRTVYPKCEALVPGYGGHVPGLNVCKFGKTYGQETREALQRVYSNPSLLGAAKRDC